jgi:exodeoxyribonuclease-3
MKLITWNVNGIRTKIFNEKSSSQISKLSCIKPSDGSPIYNLLSNHDPDFICLQETRCSIATGEKFKIDGYKSVFNESKSTGARDANRYSGTCVFYKEIYTPESIEFNIPGYEDDEGRIIIMTYDNFILINVYTPNSGTNFNNRLEWQSAVIRYLSACNKPVIYTGDMNVAWKDEDVHFKISGSPSYKANTKDDIVGFMPEEKEFIHCLLKEKYIDAYDKFRDNYDNYDAFTYWDARSRKIEGLPGCRYKRLGWRIDYFLTRNIELIDCRSLALVGTEYISIGLPQSSDHCPVLLTTI